MITIQELNDLLPTIYLSKQLTAVDWDNVSDGDKQALITQAVAYMSELRFRGRYKETYQDMPFPRVIDGVVVEVNENIKKYLCCVVYDLLSAEMDSVKKSILSGIKSESNDGYSVSYDKVEKISKNHEKFIKKYLFNGVL